MSSPNIEPSREDQIDEKFQKIVMEDPIVHHCYRLGCSEGLSPNFVLKSMVIALHEDKVNILQAIGDRKNPS